MKSNLLIERQLRGAVIIVVLAVIMYSARWTFQYFQISGGNHDFEFGDEKSGSLIVELSGDTDRNGICYLPEGTKLSDLVATTEIKDGGELRKELRDHRLSKGDKIVVDGSSLRIEKMDAPTRLALDMPLDINEATVEDLILIPGIGLKTATTIIELREKRGGISHMDVLKGDRGLGKKKFERIKQYITVN